MTYLAIYSALSTLAAVYCGWCAVKRWREKRNAVRFIRVALIQHAQALAELDVAVEWLNAANDRVRELEETCDFVYDSFCKSDELVADIRSRIEVYIGDDEDGEQS